MAAPNIVGVTTIIGVTTSLSGITTNTGVVIASNAAGSNQVYKINTIMAVNTAANSTTISMRYHNAAAGGGSVVGIASGILLPTSTTLQLIGKDDPIYLEENRSITLRAGSVSSVDVVASYEIIS